MKNIKFSIIIPTFNRSVELEQCLTSVLLQTYGNYEVLICDDGSTDDTQEMLKRYKDERIRYLKLMHAGRPSIPRNSGIKNANGEWICFLDSDDRWVPNKLETQLNYLENLKNEAICSNAEKDFGNYKEKFFDKISGFIELKTLLKTNYVITSSIVIHSRLFKLLEGFPEEEEVTAIEDYAFWLRVAIISKIYFLDENLVVYKENSTDSLRINNKMDYFTQKYFVLKDLISWISRNNIKLNKCKYFIIKLSSEYYNCLRLIRKLLLLVLK